MLDFINNKYFSYTISTLVGFLLCLLLTKQGCVDTPVKIIDSGGWVEHSYDTVFQVQIITKEIPKPVIKYVKIKDIQKQIDTTDVGRYGDTFVYHLPKDSFDLFQIVYDSEDSILNEIDTININVTDSVETETIPINHYEDSIFTKDYTLRWTAETYGFLTSMIANVQLNPNSNQPRSPVIINNKNKYNWTIGAGISNQLNLKASVGYKGWLLEGEFANNNKYNFNQLYITKQFQFNLK